MNLILIGMRGAGKSNISRRLSVLAKRSVVSTDLLIEYENGGQPIAKFVAETKGGWRAFRDLEYKVIKRAVRLDGIIMDCGGGVVVDLDDDGEEIFSARKVELLKKSGVVVWLKGDIARLAKKTRDDESRPSLDQRQDLEAIMRRRLPFYKRAADMTINIEGRKRAELAEAIFKMVAARL